MVKIEIELNYNPKIKTINATPKLVYFNEKNDDLKKLCKSVTYHTIDWVNALAGVKGLKVNAEDLKVIETENNWFY